MLALITAMDTYIRWLLRGKDAASPSIVASIGQLCAVECGGYDDNKAAIALVLDNIGVSPHVDEAARDHVLTQMRVAIGEMLLGAADSAPHMWAHAVMPHLDIVDLELCDSIPQPTPPLTTEALAAIGGDDLVCIVEEYVRVRALLPRQPRIASATGLCVPRDGDAAQMDLSFNV